jgi:hypothetical protein
LKRVKARDQQNHIPVSDKQVIDINKISAQRTFDFDLIVANNSQTDNELLEELSQLK